MICHWGWGSCLELHVQLLWEAHLHLGPCHKRAVFDTGLYHQHPPSIWWIIIHELGYIYIYTYIYIYITYRYNIYTIYIYKYVITSQIQQIQRTFRRSWGFSTSSRLFWTRECKRKSKSGQLEFPLRTSDSCHSMVMRNTTRTSDLSVYIFESWNVLRHLETSWDILRHLEANKMRLEGHRRVDGGKSHPFFGGRQLWSSELVSSAAAQWWQCDTAALAECRRENLQGGWWSQYLAIDINRCLMRCSPDSWRAIGGLTS